MRIATLSITSQKMAYEASHLQTSLRSERQRHSGVEGLRFLLAVLVFAHHAFWILNGKGFGSKPIDFAFYLMQGAVDVFFVLSGYYIFHSVGQKTTKKFIFERVVRIVPLYFTITTAIAITQAVSPSLFSNPPKNVFLAWSLSSLFIPFQQTDTVSTYLGPILSVGWSLNYEALFYLIAATLLALKQHRRIEWWLCSLALAFLLGIFSTGTAYVFLGNSIVFEFFLGCLVARYPNFILSLAKLHYAKILFWPLLFFLFYYFRIDPFSQNLRLLTFGLFSLSIITFVLTLKQVPDWIAKLGKLSYPIYLIHLPALYISIKVNTFFGSSLEIIALAATITLLLAAAWLPIQQQIEKSIFDQSHGK